MIRVINLLAIVALIGTASANDCSFNGAIIGALDTPCEDFQQITDNTTGATNTTHRYTFDATAGTTYEFGCGGVGDAVPNGTSFSIWTLGGSNLHCENVGGPNCNTASWTAPNSEQVYFRLLGNAVGAYQVSYRAIGVACAGGPSAVPSSSTTSLVATIAIILGGIILLGRKSA